MSLYRMDYQDQSSYAEMKDYGKGGMSLLSNEEFVVGQLVYIEMKASADFVAEPDRNKNHSGIVRWTKPYPSNNGGTNGLYKYGIEY